MDAAELRRDLAALAEEGPPVDVRAGRAGVDRHLARRRRVRLLAAAALVAVVALVGGLIVGSGDDEQGLDVLGPGTTHLVPDLGEDGLVSSVESFTAENVRTGAYHPVEGTWGPIVWLWTPDGTVPTDVATATSTPYVLLLARGWGQPPDDEAVWQVLGTAADGVPIKQLAADPLVQEPLPGRTLTWSGRAAGTDVTLRTRDVDHAEVASRLDDLAALATAPGSPAPSWPGLEPALADVAALPSPPPTAGADTDARSAAAAFQTLVPVTEASPAEVLVAGSSLAKLTAPGTEPRWWQQLLTVGDPDLVGLTLLVGGIGEPAGFGDVLPLTATPIEVGGRPGIAVADAEDGSILAVLWAQDGRGAALSVYPVPSAPDDRVDLLTALAVAERVRAVDEAAWQALVAEVASRPTATTLQRAPDTAIAEPPGA